MYCTNNNHSPFLLANKKEKILHNQASPIPKINLIYGSPQEDPSCKKFTSHSFNFRSLPPQKGPQPGYWLVRFYEVARVLAAWLSCAVEGEIPQRARCSDSILERWLKKGRSNVTSLDDREGGNNQHQYPLQQPIYLALLVPIFRHAFGKRLSMNKDKKGRNGGSHDEKEKIEKHLNHHSRYKL
ncbi:hypothetical protein DL95DRAFT_74921 [Leptodontidium sp. 2 PMI_412]|nr:hypothetical protein DL95DRAFT_74921 [Leptodontidium sp. 2 PMI_412]